MMNNNTNIKTCLLVIAGLIITVVTGCSNSTPVIYMEDINVKEGNSEITIADIYVNLMQSSDKEIKVNYLLRPLTAEQDKDFKEKKGSLVFQPGETRKKIDIEIITDLINEADETLLVELSDPVNASFDKNDDGSINNMAVVTIQNDDTPHVRFSKSYFSVSEGNGKVKIRAEMDITSEVEIRIPVSISGTAEELSDYILRDNSFVIKPGSTSSEIEIYIRDDDKQECPESIELSLESDKSQKTVIDINDNDIKGMHWLVGKGKLWENIGDIAKKAHDGDVVEIQEGIYEGDVAIWKQNNLLLCGAGKGAVLKANGRSAGNKGIWVIRGNNVVVQNISFEDAKVKHKNGAGIRLLGGDLTVRHCRFKNNENGILSGNKNRNHIIVEYSEFIENGAGDGQSHNIYIGKAKRLDLKFNTFRGARVGHNIKSRAMENNIWYNRIMDGKDGNASYQIDLPAGGVSYVVGNSIQQGPRAENWALVSYGAEKAKNPDNRLYLVNNTLVNDRKSGVFVNIHKADYVYIANNIFSGDGKIISGEADMVGNLNNDDPGFVDRDNFDYRLKNNSEAIDAAVITDVIETNSLVPAFEYYPETGKQIRPLINNIDIGAYEFRP
ncbi:MAG: hypothetical protein OEY68_05735 [Gammaproteobacteria bacterium]|nr:hypothetical protein [Gammaproteobacteria bacterium]